MILLSPVGLPSPFAVPEPGTLLLVGVGVVLVAWRRFHGFVFGGTGRVSNCLPIAWASR
jgi:hypothetical protein